MTYMMAEGLFILTGRMHYGVAYLGTDELRLTAPVGCGDTIRCEVEVVEARPSSSRPAGIVSCRHRVLNQDGTEVLTYRSTRMIETRPGA
jgi:acyl dehydratase